MVAFNRTVTIKTTAQLQLIDITEDALKFVNDCRIRDGLLTVSVSHATAAVIVNEHEGGLMHDMLAKIEDLFPESAKYLHDRIDDNARSHIAAAFLGHSRSFPIVNHQLIRGTWQNIFVVELDGPRSHRSVNLTIVG